MSKTASTCTFDAVHPVGAAIVSVVGVLRRVYATLRRRRERRRNVAILRGLPDWQLADIGVSRCEIESLVEASLSGDGGAWSRRLGRDDLSGADAVTIRRGANSIH